ncbi:MAG: glycosyltransferase family 39 protein, partial [Deltaproteobacteria bacterium]|nr:glycosyltransferase family 39 protein [Deltaproteobacteria bacterium]
MKLRKYFPFIPAIIIVITLLWYGLFKIKYLHPNLLREKLKWLSPLSLEVIFFLFIILLIICFPSIIRIFKKVSKKSLILLASLILLGTSVTSFIAPRTNRIYYDEHIYMNIGQNIAFIHKAGMCNEGENLYGVYRCYRLEYNKQPNGWPYILSIVYRLFGVKDLWGHIVNNLFMGISIIVVFLLGFILFETEEAALFAALSYIIIPQNHLWFSTVAVEPSASLFCGLSILFPLIYYKTNKTKMLLLSFATWAFAIQFRTESPLILFTVIAIFLLFMKDELLKPDRYLIFSIFLILIFPFLLHLFAVRTENWGAQGAKFALKYLKQNYHINAPFYIKNIEFPAIVTLIAVIGVISFKKWKESLICLLWFSSFFFIFLFFYAGSYHYGADVRYSLLTYMPIALLAGFGAKKISKLLSIFITKKYSIIIIAGLFLYFLIYFLPNIRATTQEAWAARSDVYFAKKMAKLIPKNSIILTHNPNMFLIWGKNAAQASTATYDPQRMRYYFHKYKGGVFFHYNYWCGVHNILQRSFCTNILKRYPNRLVVSYKDK